MAGLAGHLRLVLHTPATSRQPCALALMSLRSRGRQRYCVFMGSILPGGQVFLKLEFCISGEEFPTWTASFAHLCLPPPFPACTGSLEFCGQQGFSPPARVLNDVESKGLRTMTPSFCEHFDERTSKSHKSSSRWQRSLESLIYHQQ